MNVTPLEKELLLIMRFLVMWLHNDEKIPVLAMMTVRRLGVEMHDGLNMIEMNYRDVLTTLILEVMETEKTVLPIHSLPEDPLDLIETLTSFGPVPPPPQEVINAIFH